MTVSQCVPVCPGHSESSVSRVRPLKGRDTLTDTPDSGSVSEGPQRGWKGEVQGAQPKTEKPPENSCEVLACRVHECIGSTAHRMCNPLKARRFAGLSALSAPVVGNSAVVPARGRHGVSSTCGGRA